MEAVTFTVERDKLTVLLHGEIDHHSCVSLRESIDRQVDQVHPMELILDFSEVSFMDSAGVGLILGRYRWMKSLGGSVRIVQLPEAMDALLALSGIPNLVAVDRKEISSDFTKEGTNHAE